MTEKERQEKYVKVMELLAYALGIPEMKYFNMESEELLDEKIEVLTLLKKGKPIEDIPNFYKILEDFPKEGIWD